jgi:hypothetical protein
VFSLPEITFAAWPGGAVPSDKPGLLIPSSVTLIPAVISPPEPVTGARSIVLNGTFSGTGVCGTADCTIQTTASVVIPDIGTAELIGVSLSQSIDVISPIRNNNFRSVMITTAPPSGGVPPPNYFGTLFNLTSTTCFDHSGTPIPCPAANGPSVDLAGLVGLEPDFVNRTLVNSGYSVVPLCTVAADGGQNGIVTAVAFTAPGPDQVYGSRVAVHYAKSSCP